MPEHSKDWFHEPQIPEEVPVVDVLAELLAENRRILLPLLRKAQAVKYLVEDDQQSEKVAHELLDDTINRIQELFGFVEKIRPYLHNKIDEYCANTQNDTD